METLFSCWNIFWNFPLCLTVKLIKKAFALDLSPLSFFHNLRVIFLTVLCWYITILALSELMRRWATLQHSQHTDVYSEWLNVVGGDEQTVCLVPFLPVSKQKINNACILHHYGPWGYWLGRCWLRPQNCWVALYGHKVSHHSFCGHITLNRQGAGLLALHAQSLKNVNKIWFHLVTFLVLWSQKRCLTVSFFHPSHWDLLQNAHYKPSWVSWVALSSCTISSGSLYRSQIIQKGVIADHLIKNWHDLNTSSYFSELPAQGSYNNESYAGPKFLRILL